MRPLTALLIAVSVALAGGADARACTTFLVEAGEGRRVGKSYDWHTADGLVVWNPAGLSKQALVLAPEDKPARWNARHASLTFNQYGREMPNGGMNTAGLVVEIMWLDATEYPRTGQRPVVGELQWIQYLLDQAATVDEAIALARQVRVRSTYGKVHYLACDRGGACAAFEYLDGELIVHAGEELPVPTLTNDPYEDSMDRIRYHRGFGGTNPLPLGKGSPERFVRASARAKAAAQRPPKDLTKAAFGILESVRNKGYTQWQIVYDPASLQVWFRTDRQREVKSLKLSALSGDCGRPALVLDVDRPRGGDATAALTPWSEERNRTLLAASLAPLLKKKAIPANAPALLTRYGGAARCEPRQLMCAEAKGAPRPCPESSSLSSSP